MNQKAHDATGREIKHEDLVQVLYRPSYNSHPWLAPGNTLRVSHWEDRIGMVVFFKSKKSDRVCSMGLEEENIKIIARKGEY